MSHVNSVRTFFALIGTDPDAQAVVGSILDAHPNVSCSYRRRAVHRLLRGEQTNVVFENIIEHGTTFWFDRRMPRVIQKKEQIALGDNSPAAFSSDLIVNYAHIYAGLYLAVPSTVRVCFIHVTRSPKGEIESSWLRSGQYGARSVGLEASTYVDRLTQLSAVCKNAGQNYLVVNYDKLVRNPAMQVPRMFDFVGVPQNDELTGLCISEKLPKLASDNERQIQWSQEALNQLVQADSLLATLEKQRADHAWAAAS